MSGEPKRKPGRPRTVDRDAIALKAMQTYWAHGLFELSLNEVCRRCDVSKPAVYRVFGGEDELMAAALAVYRERRVLPLLAALDDERPLADALDDAVAFLTSDDGTPAGCLFTKMRIAGARVGDTTRTAVQALKREHLDAYDAFFRRGLERNDANPELDPAFAAKFIDVQFASVLVQMAVGGDPNFVREQARLALRGVLR